MNERSYSPYDSASSQNKLDDVSVLRSEANMIALYKRLLNVYNERPELDRLVKEFTGSMAGTKFSEEYSEENIRKDINDTEDIKEKIATAQHSQGLAKLENFENNFAFAEAAQAMITDRFNTWLPDFKTIMTSEFDDIKRGIDMVMKHKEGGYLGTALDVTVTSNSSYINEKLRKNWDNNVTHGNLPVVKYFKDPDTNKKGSVIVPKFIIGASAKDINSMAEAYLAGNEKSLDNHPLRKLLLEQISVQLNDALSFYESHPDDKRFEFAKKEHLRVEELIKQAKQQLDDLNIIEPLDYHVYEKDNLAIKVMKGFALQHKEEILNTVE